ncbi:n-acetylglucosamine-6-sulfatase [Trichonephila clavata]|uniref:N-acetylglucosamine-6-sulfatase n=1 Tax=Trichonephila clavata TaxID=2740835 RepID=A0A8X6KL24_TRICU|nr:n-acetylglucosamine-6-sulfatase [Trichonephila clavata]
MSEQNTGDLPNFVVILTDDQDVSLGGLTPLKKTYSIVKKHGAEFTNMFVTTPLCCPSRASILTGKYAHNHEVQNNSVNGNCNSISWQKEYENKAFITYFKKEGYSTFYAGKYLNQYGKKGTGGVKHMPLGWDKWIGLVGNSCYYNYSLSVDGKLVKHGSNPEKDYLTNVIVDHALDFLSQQNETVPFFMFLSPPAPHAPFEPFPAYKNRFSNISAPRTPNFGTGGKRKHWLLRQAPKYLSQSVIESVDDVFRNRWRTLLSVDDGVHEIYKKLKWMRLLENTYIFFTSDNGFHLGQFSLPWDKRQLYEFDIRVPLLVRGPGIRKNIAIKHPVLNIDLAPTFLELANIPMPKDFDGESFVPYLKNIKERFSNRTSFVIEHQGESTNKRIPGCPQYKPEEVHTCEIDCICEDSWNNTYICIRKLSNEENFISCIFNDKENFGEAYNITKDPFQMKNLFPSFEFAFYRVKKSLL